MPQEIPAFFSEKFYHLIYETVCTVNGRPYRGRHSTSDLNDGYPGSGTEFKRALKEFGRKNFKTEILCFCRDKIELSRMEGVFVTWEWIRENNAYNLVPGGYGKEAILINVKGKKLHQDDKEKIRGGMIKYWTPEKQQEMSRKMSKSWTPERRKAQSKQVWTPERRQKLSQKMTQLWTPERRQEQSEQVWTLERRQQMSDRRKGSKTSNITKKKQSEKAKERFNKMTSEERKQLNTWSKYKLKGIPRSAETKEKLRLANIGKTISTETRVKLSNRIWMNNSITNKRVKKEDVEKYLVLGWIFGQHRNKK